MRVHTNRTGDAPSAVRLLIAVLVASVLLPAIHTITAQPRAAFAQDGETKQERKERRKEEKERAQEEKEARKEAERLSKQSSKRKGRYGSRTAGDLVAEAKSHLEKKNWYKAREILLFLEDNEQARDEQGDVKLLLADSYYGEGGTLNWVEALSRYRTFITFFPSHPEVDRAQYQIGMCSFMQAPKHNRDQSSTRNAMFEFQKLIELYPNSPWADDAEERLRDSRNLLADHEFEIGLYYFQRGHHQAAVGRFQELLAQYPDYEGREEVYRLLAQAHYRLGSKIEGDIYAEKYRELGGTRGINEKAAKGSGEPELKAASKKAEKRRRQAEKAEKQNQERAAKEAARKEKKAEEERRKREKQEQKEAEAASGGETR